MTTRKQIRDTAQAIIVGLGLPSVSVYTSEYAEADSLPSVSVFLDGFERSNDDLEKPQFAGQLHIKIVTNTGGAADDAADSIADPILAAFEENADLGGALSEGAAFSAATYLRDPQQPYMALDLVYDVIWPE